MEVNSVFQDYVLYLLVEVDYIHVFQMGGGGGGSTLPCKVLSNTLHIMYGVFFYSSFSIFMKCYDFFIPAAILYE